MRRGVAAAVVALVAAGCSGDGGPDTGTDTGHARTGAEAQRAAPAPAREPVPDWTPPAVTVDAGNLAQVKEQAAAALAAGELYGAPDDAVPLYLALRAGAPEDPDIAAGLERAATALVARGREALAGIDDDPDRLADAREVAGVARHVAPRDEAVLALLADVERAGEAAQANLQGERALADGPPALEGDIQAAGHFRHALELRPGDARARQGLAAVESALIREAEAAAADEDYAASDAWLDRAAEVRPGVDTVADARRRLARQRGARVGRLRDRGLAALTREDGLEDAREYLAQLLRIAPAGDPAATELRDRIEIATHYGLFRPGQVFTEALANGGRGPELVVIPHGAFRMGAPEDEPESGDAERPVRTVRFERGLAVSRHEVTVAEFRRFVVASGHRTRASRRGYSTVYDERSGNLVRRGGVDWSHDYVGNPAEPDLPVVHVSAQDAAAYARWLSEQTGHPYRLPSEAEFEYMLRAGNQARYPWGDDAPGERAGNFTGDADQSPSGRRWRNAFKGYGDGAWGPAPVGSYRPNAFGLHDVAGNVSEWVADCWHDNYRRAPADGRAWINPGCTDRVVRGGSWANSPAQTRSAWRLGSDADVTSARVGFRVVREI